MYCFHISFWCLKLIFDAIEPSNDSNVSNDSTSLTSIQINGKYHLMLMSYKTYLEARISKEKIRIFLWQDIPKLEFES